MMEGTILHHRLYGHIFIIALSLIIATCAVLLYYGLDIVYGNHIMETTIGWWLK